MAIFPLDKYLLADYREQLRTNDAPQDIDTEVPILPVIPISQPLGFPKPNSKQILRTYHNNASNTQIQVATVTSSVNIYLLGIYVTAGTGAVSTILNVFDGTSGASPGVPNALTKINCLPVAGTNQINNTPLPIKMNLGIRLDIGNPAPGGVSYTVYYIEELIN